MPKYVGKIPAGKNGDLFYSVGEIEAENEEQAKQSFLNKLYARDCSKTYQLFVKEGVVIKK